MIGPELQAHYPPDWAGGVEFRAGDVHRSDDGREYKFVRFDNGTGNVAAEIGNICVFKNAVPDRQMGEDPGDYVTDRSDANYGELKSGASRDPSAGGDENPTVTSDYSDGVLAAGMFVSKPDDGNLCWIQTKGYATLRTAPGSTDGVDLKLGSTDGTLTPVTGASDQVVAVAIDASAKQVDLRC